MNYRVISYTIGRVLIIEAACLLLPLICALIYNEPLVMLFSVCALICLCIGFALSWKAPKSKVMYAREGYITVALSWIVISIFGALPFVFSEYIPGFVDALFEIVSGFTTTGASIVSDVEALPKSLLFWRSFTHWIGGMGVLVFLVAILPASGGSNFYLMKAESPGPSVSKLVPKVKSSAKILYEIYIALTLLEIVLLLFGGMNLFEALTTAFGTAGTGGFGIMNDSIAGFSPYIQVVVTVFMLIFGIDFTFYYLFLIRKFRIACSLTEIRTYLGIVATAIILVCINCRHLFVSFWETLRHSAFQVASIMTTTGYTTTDFDLWPEFSKTILVLLMFIGACAGSTGGGIKVSRVIILIKSIIKEIRIAVHPKSALKITMNNRLVEHETVRGINVFMMAYIGIFVGSMLIISLDNFDFTTNFTAVAATINNIGPGLGGVGPIRNFSEYSTLSTLVLTFDMLVGRLEIFPLLVMLSPYTWKK